MIKGGSFLISSGEADDVFTPEDFSEEQTMIRDMTEQFVEDEVVPQVEKIEHKDWNVTIGLLKRCGELGLLGIEVPEQYGGENLDKVSAMIVSEKMARVMSFSVSFGGQTGIGALPIAYFGTEEHRRRYLPKLCKAELLAAYALSESSSGSDALSAKTTAVRSDDGQHWILNGEKMWITNAAFADIFITFAQVDGKQFTCFIVEKDHPGVSTGAEENKMGLRGSSTRPLILNNAKVPISNVLGEVGKGHHVAFNILNIGRAKLAAGAVGGAKTALNDAIAYAKQRIAFGKPIASFGAIKHKLAEMAIRIWVAEGMVYRTAGLMDRALASVDINDTPKVLKAIQEYAIECSILKVFCSEVLDYVVDEAVQIYGGYGYSAEYAVERYYRDSRVNRIFEGTNEINRLIIPTMLLKRAASDRLVLSAPALNPNDASTPVKECALFVLNAAAEKYGDSIRDEQEVLMHISDVVMNAYAIDTAIHRLVKRNSAEPYSDIVRTFVNDALARVEFSTAQAIAAMGADSARRSIDSSPINTVRARRRIADWLIDHGRYEL